MRMKLLNTFCSKLSKFSHLFYSDEMRVFLSNTDGLSKGLNSLPAQSYEDLYLKYKTSFTDFYEVCLKIKQYFSKSQCRIMI
jgi:hypothetical protein